MRKGGPEIGRAAVLLTALTTVSALLGLGRDVVIAAVFGATAELDAYLVAQGLMNVVLGLAASAVATAMVPVVAREAVSDEGIRRASHSVAVAMSVMLVVLGIASLILWLAAGPVVMALAPGFDGAQADLAIETTRILLIGVVLVAGTNLLAAAAQARRRFFWAGVQGVPFNLVMIVAAVGFGPRYGVAALAVGFVVGSVTRLACHRANVQRHLRRNRTQRRPTVHRRPTPRSHRRRVGGPISVSNGGPGSRRLGCAVGQQQPHRCIGASPGAYGPWYRKIRHALLGTREPLRALNDVEP